MTQTQLDPEIEDYFGGVISRYTREQGIEDGVLVAVPEKLAREAGFRAPVAITAALWTHIEVKRPNMQSTEGRLWDVLWMAMNACKRNRDSDRARFTVKLGRSNYQPIVVLDGDGFTIGFLEDM